MRGALTDFRRLTSFLRCTAPALSEVEESTVQPGSSFVYLVSFVVKQIAFAARDGAGR